MSFKLIPLFKLWKQYIYNSAAYYSSFRTNFVSTLIVVMVFTLIPILSIYYIFDHIPNLGEYDKNTYMFFVSYSLFVMTFDHIFFSANYWHLSLFVRTGELDFYLLKPFPSLFVIFSNFVMCPSIVLIPFITGFLIFMGLQNELTALQWSLLPFCLLLSLFSTLILQITLSLGSFWTVSGSGINLLRQNFIDAGDQPEFIYHTWTRSMFLWLPSLLIISPYFYFLKDPTQWDFALYSLGFTVFLTSCLQFLWKICLKKYESASS